MKTRLLRKLRRAAWAAVREDVFRIEVVNGRLCGLSYATRSRALFEGALGMETTIREAESKLARRAARKLWEGEWRAEWLAKGYGGRRRNALYKSVECYGFGPMSTDLAE